MLVFELSEKLPRRQKTCCVGAESLQASVTHSVLELESGVLVRKDYCESCWAQKEGASLMRWRVQGQASTKKAPLSAADRAMQLLHDAREQQDGAAAYVLALYLVKAGVLAPNKKAKQPFSFVNVHTQESYVLEKVPENALTEACKRVSLALGTQTDGHENALGSSLVAK